MASTQPATLKTSFDICTKKCHEISFETFYRNCRAKTKQMTGFYMKRNTRLKKIVDKFMKLSKPSFSMECFSANYFSTIFCTRLSEETHFHF